MAKNGMSGHQSAASVTDVWCTPPEVIRRLGGAASFDLDPSAATNRFQDTARYHLTVEDDGLAHDWEGEVYLNCPYSALEPWHERMAAHGRGVSLIFARTETQLWHRYVWPEADAVVFLEGRLHFHVNEDTVFHQKGKPPIHVKRGDPTPTNAGAPSALCAYGPDAADRLAAYVSEGGGQFVPLKLRAFRLGFATAGSWVDEVRKVLERADRPMSVAQLYQCLAGSTKARRNPNWKAKIRQTLQRGPFAALGDAQWELAI